MADAPNAPSPELVSARSAARALRHGPKRSSPTYYGNMLDAGAAEQGKNFLTQGIYDLAKERLAAGGGVVEPFRLLHNMLSSQPMCFNLFG